MSRTNNIGSQQREQDELSELSAHSRVWDATTTRRAIRAAVGTFERHVASLNALNVFPVPDGDTGTNMHLTLQAALHELDAHGRSTPERVDELMRIITRGALMGARGNSGVILYQIIAGLSAGVDGEEVLDCEGLVRGLSAASTLAYKAVTNPVEGTMLSVIRAVSETCQQHPCESLTAMLTIAREAAAMAVERTPNQLPVLRQAGVVDAGGQGLLTLFTALEQFALGQIEASDSTLVDEDPHSFASDMHFLDQAEVIHGLDTFGYCINFTVTGENLEAGRLRQALDALGESTVIVGDDTMAKIHTHSERPGTILEVALNFGELHDIRIDNMRSQTERLLTERHSIVEPYQYAAAASVDLSVGIVAIASGSGVIHALKSLGADVVIPGGDSMNPSTGDIREAIESLDKSEIIILPNNPNIIASAQQAAGMCDRDIRVVPTTSVQQAIAALAAFNFDATLDENSAAMSEAITGVRSLALTRAQRDVVIDGLKFQTGQYMGILDGKPCITGPDAIMTIDGLFAHADASDYELATIFIGNTADSQLIDDLEAHLAEKFPDLELEMTDGGQPHYDLLIALE